MSKSYGFEDRSNEPKFEPVQCQPLEVKVINNFEAAFKAFRAVVQKDGVLSEYKERRHYEKPSVRRRRKISESKRRAIETEMRAKRALAKDSKKSKKDKNGPESK